MPAPNNTPQRAEQGGTVAKQRRSHVKRGNSKVIVQNSRDAVQNSAEALDTTIKRREEEAQAKERAAAAQQTAEARAAALASAARQEQEEAARQQAELEKEKAELQAQKAAQENAQAQLQAQQEAQARAAAEARSQQDAQAAAQAQQAAAQAELEKQQLRAALLQQFNRILPTTDTPRGLKANMADVLFATGKYELQPSAREALAKFTGIVLAHPGLKMQVEGYTDSVGSDTFNQTLSENRANGVRAYLIAQGIDPSVINALGYGKSNPVASNDTPAGRQQNRRVEIIISGEIIGTQIGSNNPDQQAPVAAPVRQQ